MPVNDQIRPIGYETYRAFGLRISSQIRLPELLPGGNHPDVVIRFGSVPESIPAAEDHGICFQTAPSQALISLEQVSRFLIRDGREIVIDRAPDVDEGTLRLFLLGYCLGVLLHQRGVLVQHASVVAQDGVCMALAGASSVGKSTLAAAMVRRGYTLVTDEVCPVTVAADGVPQVIPGYPAQLLWRRALEKLEMFNDQLVQVRPGLEKYVVPTRSNFAAAPHRLTHMYVLQSWNREEVELEPLEGFERFNAFLNNTYRERYLKGLALYRTRQQRCAAVVPKVIVRRLKWPQRWNDIEEAIALIEQDVGVQACCGDNVRESQVPA